MVPWEPTKAGSVSKVLLMDVGRERLQRWIGKSQE